MSNLTAFQVVPGHLTEDSQEFWEWASKEFQLTEDDLKLLTLACESLDRAAQARRLLKQKGLTFDDRFGQPHARPEVAVERDSKKLFSQFVRQLGFEKQIKYMSKNPWKEFEKNSE